MIEIIFILGMQLCAQLIQDMELSPGLQAGLKPFISNKQPCSS